MGIANRPLSSVDWLHRQFLKVADHFFRAYCFLVRPRRRGVYIVVWWNERLLLVENSYRRALTLPSGGVKWHEEPLAAAHRELEEEVGIGPDDVSLSPIGHFAYTHDHIRDDIYAYEMRFVDSPVVSVDNREVVNYLFASLEEALAMDLAAAARRVLICYG